MQIYINFAVPCYAMYCFLKKSGIFFHFCSYSCTLLLIIGHILRGNRELRLSVSGLVLLEFFDNCIVLCFM